MRTLIKNCRIVSPGSDIPRGDILMENGTISAVGSCCPDGVESIIDGEGLTAVPGFIDIHSHGRSNYDFCDGSEEALEVIGRGKLEDGVTGFLVTSLSVSVEDLRTLKEHI